MTQNVHAGKTRLRLGSERRPHRPIRYGGDQGGREIAPGAPRPVESHEALMDDPSRLNRDPYGEGWFVVVRPDDWAAASATLLYGPATIDPFIEKMATEQFEGCGAADIPSAPSHA